MLKHLLLALTLAALATSAVGEETPRQYCDRVIADADKGPKQMIAAGHLYSYGKWMGVKCVKVDYVRAFELFVKAGSRSDANALVQDLVNKLNAGMVGAEIALKKLESRGYIQLRRVEVR